MKYKILSTRTQRPFAFVLSLVFLFAGFAQPVFAQEEVTPEQKAERAIQDLKDGVLIVRLTSNHRKIEALEAAIAEDTDNAYLQKQLQETKAETLQENNILIEAFAEHYDFSEVLFMYDTATSLLNNGQQSGYFLNAQLEVEDDLSLDNRSFVVLRRGNTDRSTTTGGESFSFVDAAGNALKEPYFKVYKVNNFTYVFNKIFSPSIADERNFTKIVEKIDSHLKEFYLESGGRF